jgi:hypothetical protein
MADRHGRDREWNPELDTRWLSVSLRGRHDNSDIRLYSPVQCVACTRLHPPEVCPTTRLIFDNIHTEPVYAASASPFSEATSPNPTLTRYAEATERLHDYASYLMQSLPKFIQQFSVLKDELTLYVAPSAVIPVLTFLRDHSQCQFKSLVDISGVDFPERDKRFEVVYHLLSIKYAARIRVKTYAGEADAVPSATQLFSGANWYFSTTTPLASVNIELGMREKPGTCLEYSLKTIPICTPP